MFSQEASIVQDKIRSLDRSPLAEQDQRNVQLLLNEYSSVILLQQLRLGLYYLDFYDIPLIDDAPARQRYRRIPPSEYETVKAHINQLLEAQNIRKVVASMPLLLC